MVVINVLVLIHGMTLSLDPDNHTAEYEAFWKRLQQRQPQLTNAITAIIPIEWGHQQPGGGAPRPDQRITAAERWLHERSGYEQVRADSSADNRLLPATHELFSRLILRPVTTPIKETVLLLGVTDALYYCSPDGERAVREAVYTQVLTQLEPYRDAEQVQLHVVAHSLGATVAFDFLFGLFAPDSEYGGREPGFITDSNAPEAIKDAYRFWRTRAHQQLRLGSKASAGGQLPLMLMRKQKLVDMLAVGELLDPSVIGVPNVGAPRWKIFYDVDDVLGFPTRRLFAAEGSIREYQVNTGWSPNTAHSGYWQNPTVVAEVADVIVQNLVR